MFYSLNTVTAYLFSSRSDIAKECINRVCEASANNNMRRRGELKISNMLGEKVTVSRASANVQLTITSMCLRLNTCHYAQLR